MKKKLFALLLAVVLLISIVPVTAFAENGERHFFPMHNWDEGCVVKEATCTEEGLKVYHCYDFWCWETKEEVIPATGHTPGEAVRENEIAATCEAAGSYEDVVYCSVCENEISREVKTLEKLAHTPAEAVEENVVDATCKAAGSRDEVVYCSVCEEEISRETKTTDKLEHTKETKKYGGVAATCTKDGWHYEYDYCAVCKDILSFAKKVIDKAPGHTEEIIPGKSATCKEAGLTEGKKCSVCGEILVPQFPTPKAKHTEEIIPGKAPTCKETGLTEGKKCSVCDKILVPQFPIPKAKHTEETIPAVKATCTKPGWTEGKKCSVCNELLVAPKFVPVQPHKFAPATCTTPMTCKVCNMPWGWPLGHAMDKGVVTTEPTCEEAGVKTYTCQRFGCEYSFTVPVPALGHDYDDGVVTTEPTCDEDGVKTYTCRNDASHTYTEKIDALGHTEVIDEAVVPTCTETGLTEGSHCSVCDTVLVPQEIVDALGHDYDDGVVTTEPTCTEKGEKTFTCQNDPSHTYTEEIPALGHTEEVIPAVAPTCEESGLTEGKKCSVCGEILVKQEVVAAIGHDWDDGVITTPATPEADGVKTYTCQNDPSHTKTEAVKYEAPAADEDYDDVPKTGDNTVMILATMTGIALVSAMAFVFGKKRSAC